MFLSPFPTFTFTAARLSEVKPTVMAGNFVLSSVRNKGILGLGNLNSIAQSDRNRDYRHNCLSHLSGGIEEQIHIKRGRCRYILAVPT